MTSHGRRGRALKNQSRTDLKNLTKPVDSWIQQVGIFELVRIFEQVGICVRPLNSPNYFGYVETLIYPNPLHTNPKELRPESIKEKFSEEKYARNTLMTRVYSIYSANDPNDPLSVKFQEKCNRKKLSTKKKSNF